MADVGGIVAGVLGVCFVAVCVGILIYYIRGRRRTGRPLFGGLCCESSESSFVNTPRAKPITQNNNLYNDINNPNKFPQPMQNLTFHNEHAFHMYSVAKNHQPPAYSEMMRARGRLDAVGNKRDVDSDDISDKYCESICSRKSDGGRLSSHCRKANLSDTSNIRIDGTTNNHSNKTNRPRARRERKRTVKKYPSYRMPSIKSKTMPKHFFQEYKAKNDISTHLMRRHSDLCTPRQPPEKRCNRCNSSASHLGHKSQLRNSITNRHNILRNSEEHKILHMSTRSNLFAGGSSQNLDPSKTGYTTSEENKTHLTRSGTILELPIYRSKKNSRTPSNKSKSRISTKPTNETNTRNTEKRKRRKRRHTRKTEQTWGSGYGSLPADLSKVPDHVFQEFGVDPNESLNFEKLCRPMPTLSQDSTLSPRKSVLEKIGAHVNNKEREILANTYEYEDLGLVSTDL